MKVNLKKRDFEFEKFRNTENLPQQFWLKENELNKHILPFFVGGKCNRNLKIKKVKCYLLAF